MRSNASEKNVHVRAIESKGSLSQENGFALFILGALGEATRRAHLKPSGHSPHHGCGITAFPRGCLQCLIAQKSGNEVVPRRSKDATPSLGRDAGIVRGMSR